MSTPEHEEQCSPKMQARLRIAAILITAGLIAAALSLWVRMPLALLIYMGLAAMLSALGMAVYLYSLVSLPDHKHNLNTPKTTPS